MLIHVAVATGTPKSAVRREEFLAMHARSPKPLHVLTPDAAAADLIVLTGDFETLGQAQANSLLKLYPEKTMIYSEIDALIPFAPGVYGSAFLPGALDLRRMQSNIYLSRYGSSLNPEIRLRASEPKDLLFCFRGRRDCRVRANLLDYPYNRPDIEVLESTGFMHWKEGATGGRQAQKDYADALARSHFALCPRGMGFGSIRLFEVMEMGIAPVLLADRYALPPGPDWNSFLVQVQETQVNRLPAILDRLVAESEQRGRRARRAWETFFAPELIINRIIDQFLQIRQQRRIPERPLPRRLASSATAGQHKKCRLQYDPQERGCPPISLPALKQFADIAIIASAFALLSVIPEGNLRLLLPFCLSFPKGICVCYCLCLSVCHSRRESAFAVAFLSVILEGNLLLPLIPGPSAKLLNPKNTGIFTCQLPFALKSPIISQLAVA